MAHHIEIERSVLEVARQARRKYGQGCEGETYVIPGLRKAGIPDKSPAEASASAAEPSRTISFAR
jgi:hypothetical protein